MTTKKVWGNWETLEKKKNFINLTSIQNNKSFSSNYQCSFSAIPKYTFSAGHVNQSYSHPDSHLNSSSDYHLTIVLARGSSPVIPSWGKTAHIQSSNIQKKALHN